MLRRFSARYDDQEKASISIIEGNLSERRRAIDDGLLLLVASLEDDNVFRRAVIDRTRSDRRYLLDYAGNAMPLVGLSMLQIQDASGRIISSGHFRNEFDRLDAGVPTRLNSIDDRTAIVKARSPEGSFLALSRVKNFQIAGKPFYLVGGKRIDSGFLDELVRDLEMRVDLAFPGGGQSSTAVITGTIAVPFIDANGPEEQTAYFRVIHPRDDLEELRDDIDRWFLLVVGLTGVLAFFLIFRLSEGISKPITDLATKTERIDLDRLNVRFATNRKDEVGALSRVLQSMVGRIKTSAVRIREAERVATRGELARQVNHDIKNGLTPIRNVFSHLDEISTGDPEAFRDVFDERKSTLESSISYLEDLATNYARLTPRSNTARCDVNAIVTRVVEDLQVNGRIHVACSKPVFITADPVSIRRIVENLVSNALESLTSDVGHVFVTTRQIDTGKTDACLQLTVADNGPGISSEEQAKIFNDFYTTKENGTGLGLSIVRRLVMDMNGSIKYEDRPEGGSSFIIHLPLVLHPGV